MIRSVWCYCLFSVSNFIVYKLLSLIKSEFLLSDKMSSKKTQQVMAFSDEKIFSGFYAKQTKFQKLLDKQHEKMLTDWSQSEIGSYSPSGENTHIINELKIKRK